MNFKLPLLVAGALRYACGRMNFESWFGSQHADIPVRGALAVVKLAEEGGTVPFIARYRKEQTGGLDEVAIQKALDAKEDWDRILQRQKHIVGEIEKQGNLTEGLKTQVLSTWDLDTLEDLYLPYKVKRKTKAQAAREAGLAPLADWIWNCGHGTETPQPGQTLEIWAFTFRNEKAGINDAQAAIDGATELLIERLSENAALRERVRKAYFEKGVVRTRQGSKAKPNSKFSQYFAFEEAVPSLLKPETSHRYLAARRGWQEDELVLELGGAAADTEFESELTRAFEAEACTALESVGAALLLKAARLAFKAYVVPSIESEIHRKLKEIADGAAIKVFAENVRMLLLAPPFGPKAVLGVDPGVRTGCKLAMIGHSGQFLGNSVIHLQTDEGKAQAKEFFKTLLGAEGGDLIEAIAVGNGTAGRETEVFIRQTLKESGHSDIPVVMVNEAGASVYSASEIAREEFPELDVTVRGAVSIARRLQDPLAELVKIDPKSIGVGQYQHDVNQAALKRSLEQVVDLCVNQVGVNLNTASPYVLARVAGIGPALAKGLVEHRAQKGIFKSRAALLDVPRFSQKAFEQAAGFLRIPESEHPLDNTGVHPERYEAFEAWAREKGRSLSDVLGEGASFVRKEGASLRESWGEFTFEDVVQEIAKPGRDPRNAFEPVAFRDDIYELKDVQAGMICPGIVTNVTNFGAFVDIGVHQDGLVHISQLANKFIKDPREVVNPGDRITVKVLEVSLEKKQMSLSARQAVETPKPAPRPRPERRDRQPHAHGAGGRRGERHAAGQGRPPKGGRPGHGGQGSGGGKAPRPPKPIFNNAFAGLAALKGSLKPK